MFGIYGWRKYCIKKKQIKCKYKYKFKIKTFLSQCYVYNSVMCETIIFMVLVNVSFIMWIKI